MFFACRSAVLLLSLLSLHVLKVSASRDVSLLTCPSSNGQTYTTTDGANYTIECSYDRPYGDLPGSPFSATSLQNCINLCEVHDHEALAQTFFG